MLVATLLIFSLGDKRFGPSIWPYRMRAKAKVMSEIEEVQEQMKANMEAMKEQMATMMEAMMSMKKIMEVNMATVITASTATEVDPTHPSGLNQINHTTLDMVGQGGKALRSEDGPHFVPSKKDKERYFSRFLDIFNKLEITIPFREALQ